MGHCTVVYENSGGLGVHGRGLQEGIRGIVVYQSRVGRHDHCQCLKCPIDPDILRVH